MSVLLLQQVVSLMSPRIRLALFASCLWSMTAGVLVVVAMVRAAREAVVSLVN